MNIALRHRGSGDMLKGAGKNQQLTPRPRIGLNIRYSESLLLGIGGPRASLRSHTLTPLSHIALASEPAISLTRARFIGSGNVVGGRTLAEIARFGKN